jgi:oxygen-independent coproporphyrinogen III oxidase
VGLIQIEDRPSSDQHALAMTAVRHPMTARPGDDGRASSDDKPGGAEQLNTQPLALYVHIPFCVRKCHYCDFNSGPSTEEAREQYVKTLCREIAQSPWAGGRARTVFYGGGTPSELTAEQLHRTNQCLRDTFRMGPEAEWTLEVNPGTVTPESLGAMLVAGFNRISIGVQSFHDHHLKAIGRIHTAEEARQAFRWAGEAGFRSRNLDLIFGLPDQTLPEWASDLDALLELRPEHVSLYGLIVEEKTEFGRRHALGRLPLPEEDAVADMYEMTLDRLSAAGYGQYEISNFALPGHACRHNLVYWRNEPYLGFGVSAASFIDGLRWSNTASARAYREQVEQGHSAAEPGERLEGKAAAGEALMLALRLNSGADLEELSKRHECDMSELFKREIDRFVDLELLEWSCEGRLRLTRRGLLLSNNVFTELI